VQVCPTGIDIRNGLQMECIGCAACVDACDAIMAKIDRPRGLVRYDSLNGLKGKRRRLVRPRIIVYSIMLALGASMLGFALTKVHDVDMVATRMRGMMFFVDEESVRNQFQLRLLTKRNVPTTFTVEVKDAPAWLKTSGCEEPVTVDAQGEEQVTFIMFVPKDDYTGPFDVTIRTRSEPGGTVIERKMEFLGPDPRLFKEFDIEKVKTNENETAK
jgi:polyferredoxin